MTPYYDIFLEKMQYIFSVVVSGRFFTVIFYFAQSRKGVKSETTYQIPARILLFKLIQVMDLRVFL